MEKLKEYYRNNKKIFVIGAGVLGTAVLAVIGRQLYFAGFYDGTAFSSGSVCNLYYNAEGTAEEVLKLLEKEMSEGTIVYNYPPKSFKPFMIFRR